ncbi:porin [Phenylobacterium sp.]|uniref:OprO/OprP family phosphate-selective porin n=1 Tax=Phenylobacterium sp. TaxID=1871053 RepID=UPI00286CBA18|nr:porin [Phenylobacterium sp.]
MNLPNTGQARRYAGAACIALLMSGAASGALAAPKHHRAHAPKAPVVDARDARLAAMQQQIDEMRAQMAQMGQKGPDQGEARVAALQQQVDTVNAQLAEVKAAQTADASSIITLQAPPSGGAVVTTLPNGKPAFATADGRFTANVRANVMFDAARYFQKSNLPAQVTNRDLNSGTNFRRARFGVDGKIFKDFDYSMIMEFGGSGGENAGQLYEFYIQYSALKPWKIKLGAFEPKVGLAADVATGQMPILERPSPAEVARNVAGGDSRSALQVYGNGLWGAGDTGVATRWMLSGAVTGNTIGTINSTGAATPQPSGEQTAIIGRFAVAPFSSTDWQAHFGVNAQYVTQPNDAGAAASPRYPVQLRDRPELRIDGARLVDTGAIDTRHVTVLGAEAGLTVRNFMVEGEYFDYRIDRRNAASPAIAPSNPNFTGWYVTGVWVLTGESRSYNPAEARFDGPKPNYNFNPAAGTWGAWEIAARYSDLNLNYHDCGAGKAIPAAGVACFDAIRGGEQKISTLGLNWYLNADIRFMLDYQHVDVNRYNAAGLQVGQQYDAIALRSQLSF